MKKSIATGVTIFLIGLIVSIVFSILPLFYESKILLIWGLRSGIILAAIGAIIIIAFLVIERKEDKKRLEEEIDERDLRP